MAEVWPENRVVYADLGQGREERELHDLIDAGQELQGKYVRVEDSAFSRIASLRPSGYRYDWSNVKEQHFADQVQCYWALTHALHQVRDLHVDTGTESELGFVIQVDVHNPKIYKNAKARPWQRRILFAGSKPGKPSIVDFAADNDVVWHELGHLVINHFHGDRLSNYPTCPRNAVEEALCDVFAMSLGIGNGEFGEYAGTSRGSDPLRDLTVSVHYSDQLALSNQTYQACRIWGSACWEIRKRLVKVFGESNARDIFEHLAIGTIIHWSPPYHFEAATAALLMAVSILFRDRPNMQARVVSEIVSPVLEEWKLSIPSSLDRAEPYLATPLRPLVHLPDLLGSRSRVLERGMQATQRLSRRLLGSLGSRRNLAATEIAEMAVIESLRTDRVLRRSIDTHLGPLVYSLGPWVDLTGIGPPRRIDHQRTLSAGEDIQLVYHQRLTDDGHLIEGGQVRTWVDMRVRDAIATEVPPEVIRPIPPRPDETIAQPGAEDTAGTYLVEQELCRDPRIEEARLAVYFPVGEDGLWVWRLIAGDVDPAGNDWLLRLRAQDGQVIGAVPLFVEEEWIEALE